MNKINTLILTTFMIGLPNQPKMKFHKEPKKMKETTTNKKNTKTKNEVFLFMTLEKINAFCNKYNRLLEKWMPLITPTSVVIGVLLSFWLNSLTFLVPWIFAVMTFSGSLGTNFHDLKKVLLHPLPLMLCILLLHVVMPLIAFCTSSMVFRGDFLTVSGFVLAFIIPTGIISLMWVTINNGNTALTLSIILIDTLLSPIIVPFGMKLFVGEDVQMDTYGMMRGLMWMVVIPSLIGMLLNQRTQGKIKDQIGKPLTFFTKFGLMAVIMINSSVAAPYFKNWNTKLFIIAGTVLLLAASGYAIGWFAARLLKWNREMIISMTLNSGMRNISAGAVLAIAYFPSAVSMPVIAGMLFQQMLAASYTLMLRKAYGIQQKMK